MFHCRDRTTPDQHHAPARQAEKGRVERLGGGQGADYGLASAIALFIFILVAAMTMFNFRFTRQLEEVV